MRGIFLFNIWHKNIEELKQSETRNIIEFEKSSIEKVKLKAVKAKTFIPSDLPILVKQYGKKLYLDLTISHGNASMDNLLQLISEVHLNSLTIISYEMVDRDFVRLLKEL